MNERTAELLYGKAHGDWARQRELLDEDASPLEQEETPELNELERLLEGE